MHRIWSLRNLTLSVMVLAAACNKVATDPDPNNTGSIDESHLIAINGYPLDTANPEKTYGQLPQGLRTSDMANSLRSGASPAGGLYLLQFNGPVTDDALLGVKATGVEVVSYIPFNAYVIRASSTAAAKLIASKLPNVQFLGDYEPGFRLSPEVRQSVRAALNQKVEVVVQVVDGPTSKATEDSLATLAGGLISSDQVGNLHNVHLMVSPQQLDQIASLRDVFGLEQRTQKRILDEAQGQILAGNTSAGGLLGPGYLTFLANKGFTSSQFTSFSVEVADDTYVLGTHPDLPSSRVAFQNNPTAQTGVLGGHGFLNSMIIGGFNNGTGAANEDANGYNYGLGIAPFAKVGITAIFGNTTSTSTAWENTAYGQGARISSNSWGYTGTAAKKYDAAAQEYDTIVRDAQSGVSGNQQMMVVFAAGNDGSAANTVSSPATAKNILTSGASENVRQTGSDGCGIDNTGADNANDIISFSSRGPVNAAGGDGRIKPDLMAPGTHIEGGIPQSNYDGSSVCDKYFPAGQTLYGWSSGTSHSCPAEAGGAALVYQDFLNKGRAAPSPAMIKAYLMNSATYMTGAGANDTLPSNNQGMGRMDFSTAFDTQSRILVDQTQVLGATGNQYQVTGSITNAGQAFRVTLAWTDAPGPTTGAPWVNNLDLEVTVGSTVYKGNVFNGLTSTTGGTADSKNNVESVFLPAGTNGQFVVTVKATNIAGDGVPGNADTTDQDFALVIYNGTQNSSAPTIGVDQSSFNFNTTVGTNPPNQFLQISNTGGGSMTWTVSSNASWLTLSPTTNLAPSSTTLSVNTAGLAAGTYNGAITITVPGATNTPVNVPVTLAVNPAGTNDFSIMAAPASVSATQGTSTTTGIYTSVVSGTAETVSLTASGVPSGASVSFSPTSMTAGNTSTMTLNAGSAAAGTYTITVTGTAASATHSTPVTFNVSAPGSGITNGGFESATFLGWTTTGTTSIASTGAHGGSFAGMAGSTVATNGDSTINQTFTAPSGGGTLSGFYKIVCPDSITYDWGSVTLVDNTTSTTTTVVPNTCTNTGAWVQFNATLVASHSYTLKLLSHDDNYAADPTYVLYDDITIGAPPPPGGITNGTFETGSLSGWTSAGTTSVVNTGAHAGTYAARAGSTVATNGDSSITQTFTAPSGATTLKFWYKMTCPDSVTYDWATATLKNNSTGVTTTILAKTCATNAWTQVSSTVSSGTSYTLTLTSHDDNYAADPSYTLYDDVTVQ